ncbi:PAS domain S-box protein [Patescibacteria group bacterium]
MPVINKKPKTQITQTEKKAVPDLSGGFENYFPSLIENSPNIIIIVDQKGTIRYINRTVSGIKKEEVIGKSQYNYIEQKYRLGVKKIIDSVFRTGKSASYQTRGIGPKGEISWYETSVGTIKENGSIIAVSLVVIDVTARKKIEYALKEEKYFLDKVIESNPTAVVIFDKTGYALRANNAYKKLFKGIPPKSYNIFKDPLLKIGEMGKKTPAFFKGGRLSVPDWHYNPSKINPKYPNIDFRLEVEGFCIFDRNKKIKRYVVMHKDLSPRIKAEEKLKEKIEELERLNKLMVGRELKMVEMKKALGGTQKRTKNK